MGGSTRRLAGMLVVVGSLSRGVCTSCEGTYESDILSDYRDMVGAPGSFIDVYAWYLPTMNAPNTSMFNCSCVLMPCFGAELGWKLARNITNVYKDTVYVGNYSHDVAGPLLVTKKNGMFVWHNQTNALLAPNYSETSRLLAATVHIISATNGWNNTLCPCGPNFKCVRGKRGALPGRCVLSNVVRSNENIPGAVLAVLTAFLVAVAAAA